MSRFMETGNKFYFIFADLCPHQRKLDIKKSISDFAQTSRETSVTDKENEIFNYFSELQRSGWKSDYINTFPVSVQVQNPC